jgi:hypothetical protein
MEKEPVVLRPPAYTVGGWMLGLGFAIFLGGVLMGSQIEAVASVVAVGGMILYFLGGLLMAKFT